MAFLESSGLEENLTLNSFRLLCVDGKVYSDEDVLGSNGTLICFICNHCPYVQEIIKQLNEDARYLQTQLNFGVAALMPNDHSRYPQDSYPNMKLFATQNSLCFPYLIDEFQETAKSLGAVCTPDFFLFNKRNKLQYRGRLRAEENVRDLVEAARLIKESGRGPVLQYKSSGCSIKWKD